MQDFGRRKSTADLKDERIPRVGAHADSRDMVIHADCDIVESDDRDITVQSSPEDNTADWFSMCDNKQVFETHIIALEPIVSWCSLKTNTLTKSWAGNSHTFASIFGSNHVCPVIQDLEHRISTEYD